MAIAFVPPARAAESIPLSAKDPLASKQQIVRDRMIQLEDRMFRLTEKLAKAEPEQAKRLEGALRQARELLIRRHMEETMALLEAGKLPDAADRQTEITKDLERVLKLLLEDPDNSKERKKEIDRLQAFKDQIKSLLEAERKLKAQADAAPRLEQLLAAVRAAIARLEALIARQEKEIDRTIAAAKEDNKLAAPQLGQDQQQLRLEAESLAENLSRPLASPSSTGEPKTGSPNAGDGTPRRDAGKTPTTQPEDSHAQKDDAEHAHDHAQHKDGEEPKGSETPSANTTQPSSDSGDTETAQQTPPAEAGIEAGIRKAGGDVNKASEQMKSAEKTLEKKNLAESVPSQQKAAESLKKALAELKQQEAEARRKLNQVEAARKQRELKTQADKLGQDMQKPAAGEKNSENDQQKPGEPKSGDQPGQGKPSQGKGKQDQGQPQDGKQDSGQQKADSQQPPQPDTPGRQNVQQAGKHMEDAAEDLDKENVPKAATDEQKAVNELEKAQKELEEALDQLRKEQQEEILRGLESRFRAMLSRQLIINKGTGDLQDKGPTKWVHGDELALAGLAKDETKLADDAGQALHILKEEGTTIVFPQIVGQLQQDMIEVSRRLGEKKTGDSTQRVQTDIVNTLKELIDAIKELRKELQGAQGGGGGGGGNNNNPPLLPNSAELKLLRSCQERVNRQTEDFEKDNGSAGDKRDLGRIADRQREVAEMARKMNERITGQ